MQILFEVMGRQAGIDPLHWPLRIESFFDKLLEKFGPGQVLGSQSKAKRRRFSNCDDAIIIAFFTGNFLATEAETVDVNLALKKSRLAVGPSSISKDMAGVWNK